MDDGRLIDGDPKSHAGKRTVAFRPTSCPNSPTIWSASAIPASFSPMQSKTTKSAAAMRANARQNVPPDLPQAHHARATSTSATPLLNRNPEHDNLCRDNADARTIRARADSAIKAARAHGHDDAQ
jgi:hypothetical protein